jgi:hypothetical protein
MVNKIQTVCLYNSLASEHPRQKIYKRPDHGAAAENNLNVAITKEQQDTAPERVAPKRKEAGTGSAEYIGLLILSIGSNDEHGMLFSQARGELGHQVFDAAAPRRKIPRYNEDYHLGAR